MSRVGLKHSLAVGCWAGVVTLLVQWSGAVVLDALLVGLGVALGVLGLALSLSSAPLRTLEGVSGGR